MNRNVETVVKKIAFAMCPTNRELRTSHVAFLLKKGKVVHIGWNKRKTHPETLKHPYHLGEVGVHAELDVILKAGKEDLSGMDITVLRVDRNNKLANSKPCPGCTSILKQINVRSVSYSDKNGDIKYLDT
jgi:tRNA(Arg) A34 adenosine deaminase TadA